MGGMLGSAKLAANLCQRPDARNEAGLNFLSFSLKYPIVSKISLFMAMYSSTIICYQAEIGHKRTFQVVFQFA